MISLALKYSVLAGSPITAALLNMGALRRNFVMPSGSVPLPVEVSLEAYEGGRFGSSFKDAHLSMATQWGEEGR